jgi:regulator of protease activity HflC (stomatin/prohibitin superfamily)
MSEVITRLVVNLALPDGHPERVQSIPLTEAELQEREAMQIQAEAERIEREAEEQAKADAKASAEAKLSALGLTADEISALLK